MGEMRTLGHQGDVRTIWNPDNADEVAAARETFKRLTASGHLAFAVKENGAQGEQIRAFDPNAAKIILAPPMRGG